MNIIATTYTAVEVGVTIGNSLVISASSACSKWFTKLAVDNRPRSLISDVKQHVHHGISTVPLSAPLNNFHG